MVREASAFLLNRLFANASSPTWLSPPHRHALLKDIITPYLSSLSHHLSSSFFPPLLTSPLSLGQPGTSLTAAAASASTAISLIEELFPRTLGAGAGGGMERKFPRCEALRVLVEARPRIKAWIEGGGREVRWTLWEWGSTEWIWSEAEKWDYDEDGGNVEEKTDKAVGEDAETTTGM